MIFSQAAADLLRTLSPADFEGGPIVLDTVNEWTPADGVDLRRPGCDGYYLDGYGLDLILADQISRRGLWQPQAGRVCCFVVSNQCFSTAVHEAAHWLVDAEAHTPADQFPANARFTIEALERSKPSQQEADFSRLVAEDIAENRDKYTESQIQRYVGKSGRRRRENHSDKFTRACCHLHRRWLHLYLDVDEAPEPGPLSSLCAGEFYGMSDAYEYFKALKPSGELKSTRASIREILATPAPPEFQELWERDLASGNN